MMFWKLVFPIPRRLECSIQSKPPNLLSQNNPSDEHRRQLRFRICRASPDPQIRWIVADVDFVLKNVERQTGGLMKGLQKIEERIAKEGQVRNELLRELLESR